GNFIPMIKVLKHLRSSFSSDAVSFHLECSLYNVPDNFFTSGPADYIPAVLTHMANTPAETCYSRVCRTPCGERDIFTADEWNAQDWTRFHKLIVLWAESARLARDLANKTAAIAMWQALLGNNF